MIKRGLYKLELSGEDAVIVYRTDKNIGRIGVVYSNKLKLFEYYLSYTIPNYIINESRQMITKQGGRDHEQS